MSRCVALLGLGVATWALGCGASRRAGRAGDPPRADELIPRLFDATTVYRSMGFLVAGAPLPYVAGVRYLAAPAPDSTLALFSLSLANQVLSFRRDGDEFRGDYHVELTFRGPEGVAGQVVRDETVRVRTFQETQRTDESVIFQHTLALPPGAYEVSMLVRDRNSPNLARAQDSDTVPVLAGRGIASPIPFYEGGGRARLSDLPQLVVNPRATLPYGGDSLKFYFEVYGSSPGGRLALRAVNARGAEIWRDTVALAGDPTIATAIVGLGSGQLPLGQAALEAQVVGSALLARAPLLVSFSNQWVITNFDDIIGLLRYFEYGDWVTRLAKAPEAERPALWQEFWRATDPVPLTPENEALEGYFRRVQAANVRFREEGEPGWLTDRGEVYITLGEPDEVYEINQAVASRTGNRAQRWTYTVHRLILYFLDETGFSRYRLTPSSRAEYHRVLARVRASRQ
ncbi:MAG: GWxTD domain-containing protein [Gemmatimonadales bacterium]